MHSDSLQFIHAVSRHARTRAQQRGVRPSELLRALDVFDHDEACGGGRYALSLSGSGMSRLQKGGMAPQEIDRLRNLRVVVADDGTIVTVIRRSRRRGSPLRGQRAHRSF